MRKRNRRAVSRAYDKLCSIRFLAFAIVDVSGRHPHVVRAIQRRAEQGSSRDEGFRRAAGDPREERDVKVYTRGDFREFTS